jgi:hypothetical protein
MSIKKFNGIENIIFFELMHDNYYNILNVNSFQISVLFQVRTTLTFVFEFQEN